MSVVQSLFMPDALLLCIAIAALLVYFPFLAVGYGRFKVGYDRSAPRAMLDQLPPYARRATWAHQNSFESFIVFAPAALMAYMTGQDSWLALGAAIAYVIARLLYPVFYILDIPSWRSLMFGIGSLGTTLLFVLSCRSALL
ncbi:MAG: MAPEG family protein [Pseudanabaenales cyanobacterium]|nr:MAPEG family protein [Pseudanabaenales cyanobacterium]